jgi:hypothetical protein
MNRRRQFFSTIGLGFLLVGGAAAAPARNSRRRRSRTGHCRRPRRSTARNTRFSPSPPETALRTHSMLSRAKASNTRARCNATVTPSLFSSNGYLSSRSRRRRRHHDHLPLALMTRRSLRSRVRRPKPPCRLGWYCAPVRGNLREISSSASCVAIGYPITLALPAHRH